MSDVAQAYDKWAASYDADKNVTRDLDALVMQRVGLALDNKDVLELGSGTGKACILAAQLSGSFRWALEPILRVVK